MSGMEKVIKDLHDIAGFIAGRVGIEQARNFLRTIDDTVVLLKVQDKALYELGKLLKEQAEEIERLKTPTAGDNHIPLRW